MNVEGHETHLELDQSLVGDANDVQFHENKNKRTKTKETIET
jgi:hypothetical protein